MKTVKTNKGSELPLISLKGKDYLQVAHRLQWLADDFPNYTISTEFLTNTDDYAVCRSTVTILDIDGKVIRQATGTKQESKAHFGDFMEKAETGSIGRALAMLGLGTQHAMADLDEGDRIVDSPVTDVRAPAQQAAPATSKPSFRKPVAPVSAPPAEGEWV